jgi:hypothetical protein
MYSARTSVPPARHVTASIPVFTRPVPPPDHTLYAKQPGKCARPELPYPRLVMLLPRSPSSHNPRYPKQPGMRSRPELPSKIAYHPSSFLPCSHTFPTPPFHRANTHTNFPPAASCPQPDAVQTTRFSIRWARREWRESHGSTLPICAVFSRHNYRSTPAAPPRCQPVTPPRQRARPTVAATTSLPVRRALSIIPPLVTEPATGRPDTVTVTGLRRKTSRGSIR